MKRLELMNLFLLSALLLVKCQQPNTDTMSPTSGMVEVIVTEQPPAPKKPDPPAFKTSHPGTIAVHGVLLVLDPLTVLPDSNDAIFLVPIPSGEGITTIPPFKVGEVPQAEVDEATGEFMFTDILPGQYAVVVLEKGGSQIPARVLDSNSLSILTLKESDRDQTVELGYLRFP